MDRLDLVVFLDAESVIPEPVYAEVVTAGIEACHPDARRVERALEDGILDVRPVPETDLRTRFEDKPSLSAAAVGVIALAPRTKESG